MKDLPPDVPRLDPVPFIIADIVLVGCATFIGVQADAPLGAAPLAAIAACVGLGAIAGLYPFVINHARRQEEALQDRANQIEALARTVAASAEQISIVAASLPAVADNAARQLKAAEQLPAALESQLQTLQLQVSTTTNEENTALRQQLETLRSAETNKLVAALDKLNRFTQDITRLETLATSHTATLDETLARLPRLAETFAGQATTTLRRETAQANSILEAAADSTRLKIEASAQACQATLVAATEAARATLERAIQDVTTTLTAALPPAPPPSVVTPTRPDFTAPEPVNPEPANGLIDDAGLDEPTPAGLSEDAEEQALTQPPPPPNSSPTPAPEPSESTPGLPLTLPPTGTASEPENSTEPETEPAHIEPALSNDGFTRLIATAYIGIGNKLFIRGDGPGLRRDKGVPLQFISIGKWRWESAELLFPAKVRLYKNDQVECTTLGEFALDPGHHHEVNANF
jgi:hypothetical protein